MFSIKAILSIGSDFNAYVQCVLYSFKILNLAFKTNEQAFFIEYLPIE